MIKNPELKARLERIWTETHSVIDKAYVLASAVSDIRHRANAQGEPTEFYQIANAHDEILSCAQILERAADRLAEVLDAKDTEAKK
jgi:hypothetical protein